MYLSEIDDILDKTLDKFMYLWVLNNKIKEIINYSKLIKEPNFVKYQKDINLLIEYSTGLINEKDINKFVSKTSNVNLIKNLVLKYISYYLFLFIGIIITLLIIDPIGSLFSVLVIFTMSALFYFFKRLTAVLYDTI